MIPIFSNNSNSEIGLQHKCIPSAANVWPKSCLLDNIMRFCWMRWSEISTPEELKRTKSQNVDILYNVSSIVDKNQVLKSKLGRCTLLIIIVRQSLIPKESKIYILALTENNPFQTLVCFFFLYSVSHNLVTKEHLLAWGIRTRSGKGSPSSMSFINKMQAQDRDCP